MYAAGQKRASDPITDSCELPYGCWELSSEPLEEQPVLLTAEPSLQAILDILKALKHQVPSLGTFVPFVPFSCPSQCLFLLRRGSYEPIFPGMIPTPLVLYLLSQLNNFFFFIYLTLFYVHRYEGFRFPRTGVTDSCELPCGC